MTTTERIKSQFPDLSFVKAAPVHEHPRYQKFDIAFRPNRHELLPKGHAKEAGRKRIQVNTLAERDTPIPLRDGLHVYADIYRPQSSEEEPVPAVICWSPYGKSSISLDMIWERCGVPRDWTSGYETFEGLDPAEWCRRGYAVVNVDARGSQFSEGTFFFWGEQEAEDIYDTIEFLSKQTWCNGFVCMGGNSYLAKAQVAHASRQHHPALKAIAPWEGLTDVYRQLFRRGGMAMNNAFLRAYQWGFAGTKDVENLAEMVETHPLFDEYWEGKSDPIENIRVPMYILGSFGNPFHVPGSFDTFRRAGSRQKWMRVHSTFEWYEMYETKSTNDLQRFFDRYAKGVMNGWEHDTPPLRLSLHGVGSIPDGVERPESEFPLQRQRLDRYYLEGSSQRMYPSLPSTETAVSHASHHLEASSTFTLTFEEYTEIAGYAKIKLWMSCREHDDMDVVVQLRKTDKTGNLLKSMKFPSPTPEFEAPDAETVKLYGPQGFLRASHLPSRDDTRCSLDDQEVIYRHDCEEKITPGEIVPLEITL